MIRYALRCADGHGFESWFQSAEAFDRLASSGRLSCAICGNARVAKALMAPAVAAPQSPPKARPTEAAAPTAPRTPPAGTAPAEGAPAPVLSAPSHPLEMALRALRAQVEANAQDVGRDFARVAREIHAGESDPRAIYGEATGLEARELMEEGVPVAPLPWFQRRDD